MASRRRRRPVRRARSDTDTSATRTTEESGGARGLERAATGARLVYYLIKIGEWLSDRFHAFLDA